VTDKTTLLGMEAQMLSPGWDRETIIVDSDDDVEAHGLRGIAGIAAASVAVIAGSAGGTFLAHAGTALAPEPATLTSDLYAYSSSAYAMYTDTSVQTTAYRLSNTWTYNPNLPAGAPCSTAPISTAVYAYTTLTTTVQAMGNYRRCV
jgi:hypothetical protein